MVGKHPGRALKPGRFQMTQVVVRGGRPRALGRSSRSLRRTIPLVIRPAESRPLGPYHRDGPQSQLGGPVVQEPASQEQRSCWPIGLTAREQSDIKVLFKLSQKKLKHR
jgi:hypothetical protein